MVRPKEERGSILSTSMFTLFWESESTARLLKTMVFHVPHNMSTALLDCNTCMYSELMAQ
jgi:hypothetical protein